MQRMVSRRWVVQADGMAPPKAEDVPFTQAWCSSTARSRHTLSRLLACAAAISAISAISPVAGQGSFCGMLRAHLHASAMRSAADAQGELPRLTPEHCALSAAIVGLCRLEGNMLVRPCSVPAALDCMAPGCRPHEVSMPVAVWSRTNLAQ